MRYLNAAEAARALEIGDKTIRRWLKSGRFPSAIVKQNGEYAIPEDEIESLRKHRTKYIRTKASDQSPDVSILAEKLAALEQEVAALKKRQSLTQQNDESASRKDETASATTTQPESPLNHNVEPKRAYARRKESGLPTGCIFATEFGIVHGVPRETFNDHLLRGLGPGLIHGPDVPEDGTVLVKDWVRFEERNKRVRKDGTIEKERFLTPSQQADAIAFWKRHDVHFSQCDRPNCSCH
jgi:predicted DNA-binding transcriptional regulator AlpA